MKASVVIVNWNGRELLRRNLPRVLALEGVDFEVVVVDNGSDDGSIDVLRRDFPSVRRVTLPCNAGFAAGSNAGIRAARGEYVATLNNDAWPEPDWLRRLVAAADARPVVGVVASRLLKEGTGLVDSAGDLYSTAFRASKRGAGRSAGEPDVPSEPFSACAGAALYRRSMLDRIGGFDEAFFLVYEDVDLSFRARLSGWELAYEPDAVVHHEEGASLRRVPEVHAYHEARNLEFVWIRNVPGRLLLRHLPVLVAQRMLDAWEALRRPGSRPGVFLKGKADVLRALPRLLRERRRIRRGRTAGVEAIEAAFVPVRLWDRDYWAGEIRRILRW